MNTFNIISDVKINSRQAFDLVQRLNVLNTDIYLEKDNRVVNLCSILGVLSANISKGDKVTITVYDISKIEAVKKIIADIFKVGE